MNYVTHEKLYADTMELERRLPRDIVGVVGVPRSGLLPASIIALHRNLPLASVCGNRWLRAGDRGPEATSGAGLLLVIDDSCYRGTALSGAKPVVEFKWERDVVTAAVYGHPDTPADKQPDYVGRVVPGPRFFAWNMFHHADLATAMLDMDGVLCHDPVYTDSTCEDKYVAWLPNAEPFNLPTVPVGAICTNRLQSRRAVTEAWLARYGVRYGDLFMSPYDTNAERKAGPAHGVRKGEIYGMSDCDLFIESADNQARIIAHVSGKPVIALDTGEVYQ